jgi:hypothetical protein
MKQWTEKHQNTSLKMLITEVVGLQETKTLAINFLICQARTLMWQNSERGYRIGAVVML